MAGVHTMRDRLKRETATIHARMEREIGLADARLSLPRYIFLLARLYGFHAAWEPTVARALGDDAFWAPRQRLPLLAADLAAFGFSPADIAALPACPRLPPLDTPARAMGSLYVLEGSRLGGAAVARNLERALRVADRRGYAYFAADGDAVADRWRTFLGRLEASAAPDNAAEIVAAAVATFDRLHWWLCRAG